MRHFLYNYQTFVSFSTAVETHQFRLRCQPIDDEVQQVIEQHVIVSPNSWLLNGNDSFGNKTIAGCSLVPHKSFAFVSTGIVSMKEADRQVRENIHLFRYPSKLTCPVPQFLDVRVPEGDVFQKSAFICNYINQLLSYRRGATNSTTIVKRVMELGEGVCQDFAHVMLSMCRLNNIPARYVCGFIVGEGETHAWVEVTDGTTWKGFDPTNNTLTCEENGYIKLSHGRDASDVSVCNGVFIGNAVQNTTVTVNVFEI